jgi:hypothetical protein
MKDYQVVRMCLSASAVALMLVPSLALAQSECEQIRRDCLDYCRYGPVSPVKGRDCKSECRTKVEQCNRGMRAVEGYPDVGGYPGGPVPYGGAAPGYGAPAGLAAPATGSQVPVVVAPQVAPAYGYGVPGYGVPYAAPYYGGYGGAPYGGPPASDASQSAAPPRVPQ